MAEKDFARELKRGFDLIPGFAYKIEDVPVSRLGGIRAGSKGTGAKPFDMFWIENGRFHAIENKQEPWALDIRAERKENGKDTPGLKKHQEEALLEVVAAGGLGWVICHFAGKMSQREQKRWGRISLDRAVAVPIVRIVEERVLTGATTLNFDWFQANGVELPLSGNTVSKRRWDPALLSGGLCVAAH